MYACIYVYIFKCVYIALAPPTLLPPPAAAEVTIYLWV